MLSPTSGDARVYGASILMDMARIRQSLGVCPQFDILWPEITALEHLQLYAAIKGFRRADVRSVAVNAALDVGAAGARQIWHCCLLMTRLTHWGRGSM
jgi:ABC-type multidrug transport system ATPase subunit